MYSTVIAVSEVKLLVKASDSLVIWIYFLRPRPLLLFKIVFSDAITGANSRAEKAFINFLWVHRIKRLEI